MMKKLTIGLFAGALVAMAGGGLADAAGNGQSGPTTGDCISDVFYGNEPNMANGAVGGPAEQAPGTKGGNVVPSQSPGPKVTNGGEVIAGSSIGDYQQAGYNIPQLCRAAVGGG